MKSLIEWFNKNLKPPKFFSWQSLILVSLLIWVVLAISYLANQYFAEKYFSEEESILLLRFSFIFFGVGLAWWQVEKPINIGGFSLGPWIISALVCLVVFPNLAGGISPIAWLVWPLIAVAISSIPMVRQGENKWKLPSTEERSKLLILGLSSMLLSCWLGFSFVIQEWTQYYPELRSTDLSKSNFVIRLGPSEPSEGKTLMDRMVAVVNQEVNGKTWGNIERFLLNLKLGRINLQQQVLSQSSDLSDIDRWSLDFQIVEETEYDLKLRACHQSWNSNLSEYILYKTCKIRKTSQANQVSQGFLQEGYLNCDANSQFSFEECRRPSSGI